MNLDNHLLMVIRYTTLFCTELPLFIHKVISLGKSDSTKVLLMDGISPSPNILQHPFKDSHLAKC